MTEATKSQKPAKSDKFTEPEVRSEYKGDDAAADTRESAQAGTVYDPELNPNIQNRPNIGNTVEYTVSDVITAAQAETAGQKAPKDPPQVSPGPHSGFLTPDAALAKFGGNGVRMKFPTIVYLNTGEGIVAYPEGTHEVPKKLANHNYLKSNGVSEVEDPPVREATPAQPGNAPKTAPSK